MGESGNYRQLRRTSGLSVKHPQSEPMSGNVPVSLGVLAMACRGYGAFASNHWAIQSDAGRTGHGGPWTSLQNGIASVAGTVAPWATGLIVQINGNLRMAFVFTGGVALAGEFLWGQLVRRVEPVQWDAPV